VAKKATTNVAVDRRNAKSGDRRKGPDRRQKSEPVKVERRKLERREKVNRRRQIDPTTCERDYSEDEVEFMNALEEYKRKSGRMFPTCSEVLEVIRGIGYAKLSPTELAARNAAPVAEEIEDAAEREALEAMAESEVLAAADGEE